MLTDGRARRSALTAHDRSLLIEAGAGSGKTAILAGRIATLLAHGIAPGRIAAVTFTELAASELLARVREFVTQLLQDCVPAELHSAFPDGLFPEQRTRMADASKELDELTCSTIHGFCQTLIAPYPVEADMDPGARVIDGDQADLAFAEVVSVWLRERMSVARDGLLDEMVRQNPGDTVRLVRDVLHALRRERGLSAPPAAPLQPLVAAFAAAVAAFSAAVRAAGAIEEETTVIAAHFQAMAAACAAPGSLEQPGALVELLVHEPHRDLCRTDGGFKKLRMKTAWLGAARHAGFGKVEAEQRYLEMENGYLACCSAWIALRQNAAALALTILLAELQPVIERFQAFKRSAAVLDFDDLIAGARDLLRRHEDVRRALARRYSHVLVDEFQDTDLQQIDILWRLCGEPSPGTSGGNWTDFHIRPGALFLVGDPKQAIYRFRGADVAAYLRARNALRKDGDGVLSVSTNFRSCRSILHYVNGRFALPLSAEGQPGFTALDPFHDDHDEGPYVAALDVRVANAERKASADEQRNAEAEAVARLCARLIDRTQTTDRGSGGLRPLRAGDIALLAPTGTDMWRYEEALERHGVPVATQAGKGLYRRQEIQDLIAITRVLADAGDTLALGALLRGPLVGLTEEELADIVWALPRTLDDTSRIPRLDLRVSPTDVANPLARDVLAKLQALRRRVNEAAPHEILAQAVDVLRIRPILVHRHRLQAERALANVDLYLDLSRSYAIRGLRAFAEAMTVAWMDESRAVEGRPDSEGDVVALHTMHAAKGLEWPVVVPVNTMTAAQGPGKILVDRAAGHLYCPILGVEPVDYEKARDAEKGELQRERARLWYVAVTRSRELLVIPRLDVSSPQTAWACAVDLALADLPALDLEHLPGARTAPSPPAVNDQTDEVFQSEAARIRSQHHALTWFAPSRDEDILRPVEQADSHFVAAEVKMDESDVPSVRGGRERGTIIHKLLEEVLNGETDDSAESLISRARDLLRAWDHSDIDDASRGLSSGEIGHCVKRTLALPPIAALRPTLLPEVPVYSSSSDGDDERAVAGIVDAFSLDASGHPQLVIDWKSDVEVTAKEIEDYRTQILAYLDATGVQQGLLVFVTSGTVISVTRSEAIE